MGGWVEGYVGGWVDSWMDGCVVSGWVGRWGLGRCVDGQVDGQTSGLGALSVSSQAASQTGDLNAKGRVDRRGESKPDLGADAQVPIRAHLPSILAFFQISSAKPSDAGIYVCLAQNALGTAQKRVEVIVDTGAVAPGAPQVQVEEAELTIEAGHTATLRCSATGVDGGWHAGQAERCRPGA